MFTNIAEKYSKSGPQISLNWLMEQKNVIALFKSSEVEHIDENLGAIWWKLSIEDGELLTQKFPWQIDISDAVPLW